MLPLYVVETVPPLTLKVAPLAPEDSPISTYKITYPPMAELPALRVHDGFEWVYVLTGRLRLRLGEQDLVLTRGEAAEFDTRTPHAMSAAGARPVEVLSIFNAEGERIHTHAAPRTAEEEPGIVHP